MSAHLGREMIECFTWKELLKKPRQLDNDFQKKNGNSREMKERDK